MALPHGYSLAHSEFNTFLFSYLDEEKPGPQLTVLSALARLGFEPWGEAARLANIPREAASRALATAFAGLPDGDWPKADSQSIVTRLVNLLPSPGASSDATPRAGAHGGNRTPRPVVEKWVLWGVLAVTILVIWFR